MEGNFPMKKTARLFGAYLPVLLILFPVAVVLRTVACFKDMTVGGYFENKTLITVANVIIAALVVFSLTYLLVAKKDIKLVYRPQSPLNFIPGAIICAALLFTAVHAIITATPDIKAYFAIHPEDRYLKMLLKPAIALLVGITALCSIPYFAVSTIWAKGRSVLISNLGLTPLVFLCFMVANIYFDNSAALNMPGKIISLMAYLSAALFFLYEIRLPLGREKWRAYVCFGMICTALCAYSAIPSITVFIVMPGWISRLATSEFELAVTLAIFLFAVLKLILAATLTEDRESAVTQRVREYALARAASLEPDEQKITEEPVPAEEEEADEDGQVANQESFFDGAAEENETVAEEDDGMPVQLLSEFEEISEERRLELSANIETTNEEVEKETDDQ